MEHEFSATEHAAYQKFLKHKCRFAWLRNLFGLKRTIDLSFHSNGIGVEVVVRCSCGAKQDITDVSRW
jgi:hypothetical protein